MRLRRVAVSAAGPALFGLAAVVGGRIEPGYRARDEPVSALAARGSPAAKVMVPGFLGLAVGTAALSRELRGTPWAPVPVPGLLQLAAITTAGAGLARCSSRACPTRWFGDADATVSDDLHAVFSLATFALWIAVPMVASRRAMAADQRYRDRSGAVGSATLAAFVAGGLLTRRPSRRWSGWAQRLMLGCAFSWYLLAGAA